MISPGEVSRGLALALLLPFSAATPVSQPEISTISPPNTPAKPSVRYMAFGDSYAVGLGAGTDFSSSWIDMCYRSNGSYANQLNLKLNGEPIADENFKACSGATTDDVVKKVEYLDEEVELASITVGGNDVGFSDVVLNCVYKPFGSLPLLSKDCNKTINEANAKIESSFGDGLHEAFRAFMERPHHPDLQIIVTGYAHFFNAETHKCHGESWNLYDIGQPDNNMGARRLTHDLRERLNDYGININAKIEEIVNEFTEADPGTWHFVNYDSEFEGHRFCEGTYTEPADNDEDHPETWFQQRLTIGSPFHRHVALLNSQAQSPPKYRIKILHPTFKGHTVIMEEIWKAYRDRDVFVEVAR